jgi:hypothetical protein
MIDKNNDYLSVLYGKLIYKKNIETPLTLF